MATLPVRKDVRCTYATCSLSFDSKDAMDVHKTDAEDHFYCSKCDMDFVNHALLHLHKVMSEHHFACLECETEYRSDAGLKHHVKMVRFRWIELTQADGARNGRAKLTVLLIN
jgi:hypothetical protein